MRATTLILVVTAVGLAAACNDDGTAPGPTNIMYSATLNGANERPNPVTTTNGTGTFSGTLDPTTNILTYTVSWSNLGSTSANAHIHGPIAVGSAASAGVLVDFNNVAAGRTITHGTSGNATGTINFNTITTNNANVNADSLKKLFNAGAVYVNVHSTNFPGGEVAGIITKQ